MKRSKIVIPTLILLSIAIFSLAYFSMLSPLNVENTYVTISKMPQELMDYYIDVDKYVDSGREFETENADDFYLLNINYELKNRSFLKFVATDYTVNNPDEVEFINYNTKMVKTKYFEAFETYLESDSVKLTLFCPNMTEEEVLDLIKDIEIRIDYKTKLFDSLSKVTKLDDFEVVENWQDFLQEYRQINGEGK